MDEQGRAKLEEAVAAFLYKKINREDEELPRDEYLLEARNVVEKIISGAAYRDKGQLAILAKEVFKESMEGDFELEPFLRMEDELKIIIKQHLK